MDLGGELERIIAGRWIAGPEIGDAVTRATKLNAIGIGAIVNYLGEEFTGRRDVKEAFEEYLDLIDQIKGNKLNASISVKMSELGLLIGKGLAESNYESIVKEARKRHIFVWLDMEGHEYVDDTIDIYRSMAGKGDTGICIQAYLRRSMDDVKEIVRGRGIVRLVKGAYREGEEIAFTGWERKTQNYREIMAYLFAHAKEFTIATHDTAIISDAVELNRKRRRNVTFAMLNGIRNKYAAGLVGKRQKVALYVPYGRRWMEYAGRRLSEMENLRLLLGSVMQDRKM